MSPHSTASIVLQLIQNQVATCQDGVPLYIIGGKAMLTPTSNNTVRVFIGPWETCMSVAAYQRCVHVGQILIWSHELHYLGDLLVWMAVFY